MSHSTCHSVQCANDLSADDFWCTFSDAELADGAAEAATDGFFEVAGEQDA
jgi:hypothetical protein